MISTRMLIFAPRMQGNYYAALRNAVLSACLAGLLALCGGFMEVIAAQIETGTIVGTVTDASEAVLPGVKVEIRSVSTGLTVTVTTNEAGRYQSPPLKPDNYEISATMQDFKTSRASLRLEVNQRVGLDFKLEPGAVTDAVTVTGFTPLLETENSTLGNVRSAKAVADLPLNARNFAFLITLSPGAAPQFDQTSGTLPGTTRRGVSNAAVNGVRGTNDWNSILIEGVDNTENHNGFGIAVFPPVDAIQEFKIQTNSADAQFGRAAGGITNLVLKSGGRDFHGSLYEFHRNSAFDARNFFLRPTDKDHFVLNQFGGTLSGPVFWPGRYNKERNRTFFFVSTQIDIRRQGLPFVSTVPTAKMRNGDFSESPNRIYDPLTLVGNTRTQFPGNVIPAARFNPVGKNVFDLYPLPNQPGLTNNYVVNASRKYDGYQLDYKLDHYFSTGHSLTFRGSTGNTEIIDEGPLPLPASASTGPARMPVGQYAFIDRYTLSPTLTNEFRFGFTRFNLILFQPNEGKDLATELGIPGVNTGDTLNSGLPRITITGFRELGDDPFNPGVLVTNNFQTEDNLFYNRGNHSLRFGLRWDRRQYNAFQTNAVRGIMNFTGVYTTNPASTAGTGIGAADLLLGAPISGNISIIDGTRGFRRHELGFYAHDDWKATPRLTLNVGLRYELYPSYPWVEVADRGAFLDFQTLTVSQLGTGNISRTGVKIDKNNFAPRIGLAYKLTDKTVIRSAYGIFYAAPQYEISRGPAVNPPFAGAFSFNNNQLNFTGARKIDQGFERTFSAADATLFAIDPNLRMPYVQQWNLNIQQQLPGDMTLTTAYVGTKGVKLRDQININQPRPGPGAVAPRRPFPQFNNIELTAFRANSIYHGLQATLDKRFTGGLSFLVSYTYSHAIDDADVFGGGHQDVMNLRADRGNAPFDIRQMLVVSYNYDLPFAKNASGLMKHIFRGWQTNGVLRLTGGTPFTPTMAANTLNGSGFQRPNVVAGCGPQLDNAAVDRWFDTSCFAAPPQFTFGNAGRNVVFGPGTKQLDFSVLKRIPFGWLTFLEDEKRRDEIQLCEVRPDHHRVITYRAVDKFGCGAARFDETSQHHCYPRR
jgi:Carboxypeptidase regulatory-like domain/TonB dependent receptor-like, beta-barrel